MSKNKTSISNSIFTITRETRNSFVRIYSKNFKNPYLKKENSKNKKTINLHKKKNKIKNVTKLLRYVPNPTIDAA